MGSVFRGMVRREDRGSSRKCHRVAPVRARVPARCHASGAAVDVGRDVPAEAQRAERTAEGGVVDVPHAPRINAQRVA